MHVTDIRTICKEKDHHTKQQAERRNNIWHYEDIGEFNGRCSIPLNPLSRNNVGFNL